MVHLYTLNFAPSSHIVESAHHRQVQHDVVRLESDVSESSSPYSRAITS